MENIGQTLNSIKYKISHPCRCGCPLWVYGRNRACCLATIAGATILESKSSLSKLFNTLRLRREGHLFSDNIFKHICLNEKVSILIKISLKFARKGSLNNKRAFVQIIAWYRPLSEPMMVSLLMHVCITRPQSVKNWAPVDLIYGYPIFNLAAST